MSRNRLISVAVAVVIGLLFGTGQFKDLALFSDKPGAGSAKVSGTEIAVIQLPAEAKKVITLIRKGGPFPYRKDGTVFQNREGRLPDHKRGYYREYTVKTPGASNRGARRIVAGGKDRRNPAVMYYTADHYESFKRIVERQQ